MTTWHRASPVLPRRALLGSMLLPLLPSLPWRSATAAEGDGAATAVAEGDAGREIVVGFQHLFEVDRFHLSARARGLDGKTVTILGFMAPPLAVEAPLFVMVRFPQRSCPFCDPTTVWPSDIVLVKLRETLVPIGYTVPIAARGRLSVGMLEDQELGLATQLRLEDASYQKL